MPLNFPYTNPKVEKYVLLCISNAGRQAYHKHPEHLCVDVCSESENRAKEDPRESLELKELISSLILEWEQVSAVVESEFRK